MSAQEGSAVKAEAGFVEYRQSKGNRIAACILFGALILGLAIAVYAIWSEGKGGPKGNAIVTVMLTLLVGALAAIMAGVLKSRVRIHPDRIEWIGLMRGRTLAFGGITGFRTEAGQHGQRFLLLIPAEPRAKPLKIALGLERKAEFEAWVRGTFPDLDEADRARDMEAILADASLGADPEARGRRYDAALRVARVLSAAGTGAALWGLFFPRPYLPVMWALLALPFLAMAATAFYPGLIRFQGPLKGAYPSVNSAIAAPAFVLALRGFLDFDLVWWSRFWLPCAAIAGLIAATLLFRFKDARQDPKRAGATLLIACVYGVGATFAINGLNDGSHPTDYRACITRMHVNHGKSTTYHLTLSPWGPRTEPKSVQVDADAYQASRVGDSVTVHVKRGNLDIPWFYLTGN